MKKKNKQFLFCSLISFLFADNKIKETPETIIFIKSPEVDITPEQTSYCYVLRPDQMKNDFPQHSTCKFPKFDNFADANGIWQIVAGLKGKTAELTFQVDVQSTIGMYIVNTYEPQLVQFMWQNH